MGTEEHTSQFSVSVNPGVLHTRHHKGDIALYLAAENGYFIARVLIENGADINQYTNKYTDYLVEFTPLRAAISKAHIDIINLLLEHNVDVNLPFAGNSTALFSAIGNVSSGNR